MAGVIGMKSLGRSVASVFTRPPSVLALLAVTSASLMRREWSTGTCDRLSLPPATTQSRWPRMIWSAASVMAWLADAQARLTVKLCTPRGSCGMSEISRAMLGSATFCTTVPNTTACTSAGSSSARASSSATQRWPSSVALRRESAEPARANGVRRPATMATRRPGWP
jgi:hypothetical protein